MGASAETPAGDIPPLPIPPDAHQGSGSTSKGGWKGVQGCPLATGPLPQASSWGHLLFQASPPPQTPSPPPPSLLVNLLSICGYRAAWETEEREGGQRLLKTTDDLACAPPPIGSPAATTALNSQRGLVLAPSRWVRGQGPGRASLGLHGPRNVCSMTTVGQQDPQPRPQAAADSPLPPTGLTHSWGARGGAGGACQWWRRLPSHRTREMWPGDRSPVCGPAPESQAGITEGGGNVAAEATLIMKLLIRPHLVTTRKAVGLSRWGSLPGMHWDLGAPRGLWAPPQDQPLPKS